MLLRVLYLFFFKQKTAYEMRISDWSSDVCSSDLCLAAEHIKSISQDRIDTLRAAVEGIAEELGRAEITAASNSCSYHLGSLRRGQRKTFRKSNAFIELDIEIIEREGQSPRRRTKEHTTQLLSLIRRSLVLLS